MWVLSSSVLLGWALGANNAANIFGPAVTSHIFRFMTAALLAALFVIIGAMLEGGAGMATVGALTDQSIQQAFLCMISAGIVAVIMTFLRLPISTSQAVIGAVIGAGIMGADLHLESLVKVIICWVGTPIGGALICYALHVVCSKILRHFKPNIFQMDKIIRGGLVICCIYGAYALGANNVANTTAVFVKAGVVTSYQAQLLGSVCMGLGIITFSKPVIRTVGQSIVPLDAFSSLISLLASAVTVHFYAIIGVPVSSSQAIIGAVLGIGLIKGLYTVNYKSLIKIILGWISTPILAILISMGLIALFGA